MIILYVALFIVACALIGKLLTKARDKNAKSLGGGFPNSQRPWPRNANAAVDPVENPRMVDDGTEFGYKEFD